jgi:hypothetical protein
LRRARSLAGAPHAGSCALLQALYLLKGWTEPSSSGEKLVHQSPSVLHSRESSTGAD